MPQHRPQPKDLKKSRRLKIKKILSNRKKKDGAKILLAVRMTARRFSTDGKFFPRFRKEAVVP